MANKILQTILNRKIETFVSTFVDDSTSIFFKEGQLIHPGEFGKYREESLKSLLRFLINSNFRISDGFLITSNDKVSTQCDIVIYDSNDLPLLENDISQFFTIESVLSIGEVKSTLDKTNFKNALIKLAENKKMSENIHPQSYIIENTNKGKESNSLISFLVCKKLSFNINDINYDEIYEGINREYRHNLILSIEDGLIAYNFDFTTLTEPARSNYIRSGGVLDNNITLGNSQITIMKTLFNSVNSFTEINNEHKFHHILVFLTLMKHEISRKKKYNTDLLKYIDIEEANLFS